MSTSTMSTPGCDDIFYHVKDQYDHLYRVDTHDSELSDEDIRIICGLIYATKIACGDVNTYTVNCNVVGKTLIIINDIKGDTFTWDGDTLTKSYVGEVDVNEDVSHKYIASRYPHHTVLFCSKTVYNEYQITLTFVNGLLESINDQAAIHVQPHHGTIGEEIDNVERASVWFHQNTCYRPANPDVASIVVYGYFSHSNSEGRWHRTVGPALYHKDYSDDDEYFVNGVKIKKSNRKSSLVKTS